MQLRDVQRSGSSPGRGRLLLAPAALFLTLALAAAPAAAQGPASTTSSLQFESLDQSMWGPGRAAGFQYDKFLGVTWDKSAEVGKIVGDKYTVSRKCIYLPWPIKKDVCTPEINVDTRTGAKAGASTHGAIGLDVHAKASAGRVDVRYPVQATLGLEKTAIKPGETFKINSSFIVNPEASLATEFPNFEAWADLRFDVFANAHYQACLIGPGCTGGSATLVDIDKTYPIVSVNRNGDGAIKVLGSNQTGFELGKPIALGPVTLTAHEPELNTAGGLSGTRLASAGGVDVLSMGVDVPKVVADFILPGSSNVLSGSIFGAKYKIFEASLGPTLGLAQDFVFDATPKVSLTFSDLVQPVVGGMAQGLVSTLDFRLGDSYEIRVPEGTRSDLKITPFYYLENVFTAKTDITTRLDVAMEALSLDLPSPLPNLGPLFKTSFSTAKSATTVDRRSFAMNFGTFEGDALYVTTRPGDGFTDGFTDDVFRTGPPTTTTPEPVSMALLGTGLAGLGALRRKRKKVEEPV